MGTYKKKRTTLTTLRTNIQLFYAVSFYIVYFALGFEFEVESEYAVLLLVFLAGPLFCGWSCPFGATSYFMLQIRRKLFPKLEYSLPKKVDKYLRFLRYGLLVYFIYMFIALGVNYFGDHMEMYFSTSFSTLFIKTKHLFVILVAMFIPYFFCKYLCWQKAAYNLISKYILPSTKIVRDEKTCIGCKKCSSVCPMSIDIANKKEVKGWDCFECFNCLDTDICPPKKRSLQLKWFGIKVNPLYFSMVALIIYWTITLILLF